jgi:hypothetical protein
MDYLFGLLALLGFILSLAVHIASLFHIDVAQYFSFVWVLHLGIFVVFIPFVFISRKLFGNRLSPNFLQDNFSVQVIMLGKIILFYVVINFILFMIQSEGASPSILNGKFALTNHGKLVREITENEYHLFQARVLRGFSGHWLMFYFIPLVFFLFRKKRTPVT